MDAIGFGCIVVDHRRAAGAARTGDAPLRIVGKAVDLHVGGIPILAAALQRMGFDVALMGCVGRDIAGYGLRAYLAEEAGLNVEAVRTIDAPTSSSFIRLTQEQRYVDHTPGASAELLPGDSEMAFVARHKPALLAIGYAGLLRRMDADGGRAMAEWIAAVQEHGTIVALDTHTVPPYAMLQKPVPAADIFICNKEEGAGITGLRAGSPDEIVWAMWSQFRAADPSRYRLLGLAMPEGAQLAYGRHETLANEWIPNHDYGTFTPTDLTGAGDNFRAGVYAEVITQRVGFFAGRLDLSRAGQAGHKAACRYLQGAVWPAPDRTG
jgi:sugar/nucleoside kinase (ribokinase family)